MNKNDKTFIVAEISANHGHSIEIVKSTIEKAKEIGCDAVKIQTYRPDTITIKCSNDYFKINSGTMWDGKFLYDLYEEAYLPWEWHMELFEFARKIGIMIFSTPFDKTAVDLLEKCGNPIYKIASFEITDIPLIEYAASQKKTMIISTGIASKQEIEDAVLACRNVGNNDICLLKCTSQYPALLCEMNLSTMLDMAKRFDTKIGLSDHSEGFTAATIATAMGAKVIEKHFILDKNIGGPDASFSMEPDEFKVMIEKIREVESVLGEVTYKIDEKRALSRKFSRSLFVVENVKKGDVITEENVKSIRPSNGLKPKYYKNILGKHFARNVDKGTPVTFEMIKED